MYSQVSIIIHHYCNIYNESVIFTYFAYPIHITRLTDCIIQIQSAGCFSGTDGDIVSCVRVQDATIVPARDM